MSNVDLANVPAMAAPYFGYVPDFDGVGDQGTLIITSVLALTLSGAFVGLRLYTTLGIIRAPDVGDFLIFSSWSLSVCFTASTFMYLPYGAFRKHLYDVRAIDLQSYYLKWLLPSVQFYTWSHGCSKLSLLWLYHRINTSRWNRIACYLVGGCVLAYNLVFLIVLGGPCNLERFGETQCFNNSAVAQAGINIFLDICCIILPLPTVHDLNMPLRQRLMVGCILALGSAGTIVAIARVASIVAFESSADVTWVTSTGTLMSMWDVNVAITCNCAARLKPFLRRHIPWLVSSDRDTSAMAGTLDLNGHHGENTFRNLGDPKSRRLGKEDDKDVDRDAFSREEIFLHSPGNGIKVVEQFELEFTPKDEHSLHGRRPTSTGRII